MKFIFLFSFILPIFLLSCAQSHDQKTEYEFYSDPSNVFHAQLTALAEPNQYRLDFTWPEDPTSEGFAIVKRYPNHKEQSAFVGRSNQWIDSDLRPGEKLSYILMKSSGGTLTPVANLDVIIPFDLVIEGTQTASDVQLAVKSKPILGRLYLKRGATLITSGTPLTLIFSELQSESGTIRTFQENQLAAAQVPGRNGGRIHLKFQRATGFLTVILSGENGGKGRDGEPGAGGGNGADGGSCQSGRPGGNGQNGTDGSSGAAGGNSGSAWIEIEENLNFQTNVRVLPGLGGAPGIGGSGGPGGQGGKAGHSGGGSDGTHPRILKSGVSNYSLLFCEIGSTSRGSDGTPGKQGQNGKMGAKGIAEPYCVQSGKQQVGSCETIHTLFKDDHPI